MSRNTKNTVFDKIYLSNSWGDKDSKSGTGSNLKQTEEIRIQLPGLLKELNAKSILDIPCGDFYWMNELKGPLSEVIDSYLGADIVEELVSTNNSKYSSVKFNFKQLDLVSSTLPKVDLVFSRDCLVHLSYRDIYKALKNIRHSGSRYLLTTSFQDESRVNGNIKTGDWRPLNLERFPFSFPIPKKVILEKCTEGDGIYADKSLLLWELKDLNTFPLWLEVNRLLIANRLRKLFRKFLR